MAKVGMQVHSLVIKCGLNLSIENMCDDVVAVVKEMYGDSPPTIVLVGHRHMEEEITSGYRLVELNEHNSDNKMKDAMDLKNNDITLSSEKEQV
ncbi:hypothetical protein SO802_021513 [Lithocarpus litseifolius]|uniref:Uncharacterized protein n=1 Tax=Lithocarpus litseifolius TaxID=425828 RepID=A0AAW2CHH8_9ROSI